MAAPVRPDPLTRAGASVDVFRELRERAANAAQQVRDLVLEKKYKEADELLHTFKAFHPQYQQMSTFNALLETILERPEEEERCTKAAMLCGILENQSLASDTSRLFNVACLVSLGNTKGAAAHIALYGYAEGLSKELQAVYVTLGQTDMIRLLEAADAFAAEQASKK